MLDPARNPPKSYRYSMAFLIVHNSVIIWHMGKMGENKQKRGEAVPRKRRQVGDSGRNLGNLVFLGGPSCL